MNIVYTGIQGSVNKAGTLSKFHNWAGKIDETTPIDSIWGECIFPLTFSYQGTILIPVLYSQNQWTMQYTTHKMHCFVLVTEYKHNENCSPDMQNTEQNCTNFTAEHEACTVYNLNLNFLLQYCSLQTQGDAFMVVMTTQSLKGFPMLINLRFCLTMKIMCLMSLFQVIWIIPKIIWCWKWGWYSSGDRDTKVYILVFFKGLSHIS